MTEIAVFPIPNCIVFPYTVFPLHVFEPRYRQMVDDCIVHDRLLGICHTQKQLRAAKAEQSVEEALQSNQATYKPQEIFSAGRCELLKTLDDGRLFLQVDLRQRYRIAHIRQTLPYLIAECEPVNDEPQDPVAEAEVRQYQEKILTRLAAITSHLPKLMGRLQSPEWRQKDPQQFSFEIFSLLEMEPNHAQEILEMRSPVARLEELLMSLNHL